MNRHLITLTANVADALARLNSLSGDNMTLVVVDADNRPCGTLTDGDIRRALLSGVTLSDPVVNAMHSDFSYITVGEESESDYECMRDAGIRLLPVVDKAGKLVRLDDLTVVKCRLPLSALIMAGGVGERLRPATLTVPKPLLTLSGRPVIDYAVELLQSYGIEDITVAVRYLGEKIVEHFASTTVKCVTEDKPLGTIGALSLVGDSHFDNILVMNSDLITDLPIDEMYRRHIASVNDITIAAVPYTVSVPYAILATDGNNVSAIDEKPTYSYYANAGIYLLNRRAASIVENDKALDATDLISAAIERGMRVGYFPLDGMWIDIGTHADFRHAEEILNARR